MPASSDVRTHHCAVLMTVTMASTETVMDRDRHSYRDRDRDEMRGEYKPHHDHLTPGLGKCDPVAVRPGEATRCAWHSSAGLRQKIYRRPADLERRLPPAPPNCEHVLVGGHLILLNRRTLLVVDVFHFEVN